MFNPIWNDDPTQVGAGQFCFVQQVVDGLNMVEAQLKQTDAELCFVFFGRWQHVCQDL